MKCLARYLAVVFLVFPTQSPADGWYFSAAVGAATSIPESTVVNAVKYRNDRYTITDDGDTELQDHVKVEIGYKLKKNLDVHYFHLSDPTRHNDGIDGIFFGFKWGG